MPSQAVSREVLTSYAQNFEDVMLWRALGHVGVGCYIDIGAQDPVVDSVSLAFYERGWRGVHVEPAVHYASALRTQRPEDTVFEAAVAEAADQRVFYEIPGTGISTLDPEIAHSHRQRGFEVIPVHTRTMTLEAVFGAVTGRDIHWLKIDVEGYEAKVLQGWGDCSARPWVVVVESTLPLTTIETHTEWEPMLLKRGYRPAYFDGLNRFYVAAAHPELASSFAVPPNVFDNFVLARTASVSHHHGLAMRLRQRNQAQRVELKRLQGAVAAEREQHRAERLALAARLADQALLLERLEGQDQELQRCRDEAARLRLHLAALRRRVSWQLTRPLRALHALAAAPAAAAPESPPDMQGAARLRAALTLDDEAFVCQAYRSVLLREADPDGLRHYTAQLRQGVSKPQILDALAESDEAQRLASMTPAVALALRDWRGQPPRRLLRLLSRLLPSATAELEQRLQALDHRVVLLADERQRQFAQLRASVGSRSD